MPIFAKLNAFVSFFRNPNHLKAREHGDKARDRKDWVTAISKYTEYLQSVPRDPAINIQLGHCLKETGDYQNAGLFYDKAYAITPNDDDLALQIGHLEKLKGNKDLALQWYIRSSTLNSENKNAKTEIEELQNTINAQNSNKNQGNSPSSMENYEATGENLIICRNTLRTTSEKIKQRQIFKLNQIEETVKVLEIVR